MLMPLTCNWIQGVMNVSLKEGVILLDLKKMVVYFFLKKPSPHPTILYNFCFVQRFFLLIDDLQ